MNDRGRHTAPKREIRELKIQEELIELLIRQPPVELRAALDRAVARHGVQVYPEALYLLAHLRFSPDEARRHWQRILRLNDRMSDLLDSQVDVRVALVSYFLDIDRKLQSPTVVELRVLRETQSFVYRDGLTGLYNYRYFRDHITREIDRFERFKATLSLLMIDIDDFKVYNDQNGHQLGNDALVAVARLMEEEIEPTDTAIRYGGEEFVLLLPGVPKSTAIAVAESVRARIEAHPFENERALPSGRLTVSIGLATYPADADDGTELLLNADRAMYAAKSMGRNRVHMYGDDMRSYRRVAANSRASVRVLDSGQWACTTLNISEGGLLLHSRRSIDPGAVIEVDFEVPDTDRTVRCIGRVLRVNPVRDGLHVAVRIVDVPVEQHDALVRWVRTSDRPIAGDLSA